MMCSFSSPFEKYLETNYVPTKMDRIQLQELLVEPEDQLTQLNTEVLDIQATLEQMVKERDELQKLIDGHYNLLAPMRSLPDDILREIFLHCLPTEHNAVMSAEGAPLLLGRVCSRWRYIIYHTPRAWATIHVPIPLQPQQIIESYPLHMQKQVNAAFANKVQRHCQFIEDWLLRSGSCPLSISFHPRENTARNNNSYVRSYFDVLVRFLPKWWNIEMTIPSGDISLSLATIPPQDLPILESVDLRFVPQRVLDAAWTTTGLLSAKHLTSVRLQYYPNRVNMLQADWSMLTHLVISDLSNSARYKRFTLQEASTLLKRCGQLVKCSIDILDTPVATADCETIPMLHLRSLNIIEGARSLASLFECLEVPALRYITFHTIFYPDNAYKSSLITLLSRTQGNVQRLTTDVQFFTRADFVECLELTPSLVRFTNQRGRLGISREQRSRKGFPLSFANALLDILTPTIEGDCYWRKLQVIKLKDAQRTDDDAILSFIHGRMGPGAPSDIVRLKQVTIGFASEEINDIRPELQKYVDEGMELNFTYVTPARRLGTNFSPWNGLNRWSL